jgi:hypothetical protein
MRALAIGCCFRPFWWRLLSLLTLRELAARALRLLRCDVWRREVDDDAGEDDESSWEGRGGQAAVPVNALESGNNYVIR